MRLDGNRRVSQSYVALAPGPSSCRGPATERRVLEGPRSVGPPSLVFSLASLAMTETVEIDRPRRRQLRGVPLVLSLAAACSGASASQAPRADAAASPSAATKLSHDEICALTREVVHKRWQGREGGSIIEQPCARDQCSMSGKIAADVWVTDGPLHEKSRRPFQRGETCGDDRLLIVCEPGLPGQACSRNRSVNRHWKLGVHLVLEDNLEVDARAFAFLHHDRPNVATMPTCPSVRVRFSKKSGKWEDMKISSGDYWR